LAFQPTLVRRGLFLWRCCFLTQTKPNEICRTMSAADSLEDRKGDRIKLLGGTAKKHHDYLAAWLDKGKPPTKFYYYIIVEMQDPEDVDRTYLDSCKAMKSNVAHPDPPPTTYIQAAFQQVPQLASNLADFSRTVAKCRIRRCRELSNIIRESLDFEALKLMTSTRRDQYYLIDTTGLPGHTFSSHGDEAEDID